MSSTCHPQKEKRLSPAKQNPRKAFSGFFHTPPDNYIKEYQANHIGPHLYFCPIMLAFLLFSRLESKVFTKLPLPGKRGPHFSKSKK
jgi:hypothetical protein